MPALRAVFAALVIPLLGAGLTLYIIASAAAREKLALGDAASLCLPAGFSLMLQPACASLQPHYWLLLTCAATALVGVFVIALFTMAGFITGANRVLLSFVFPGVSFIGLMLVAIVVAMQIGIIAAAAYLAEAFFFHEVHTAALVVLAGFGAFFGLSILWTTVRMFRPAVSGVVGVASSPIEQPRLALLVQQIAKATGARMPDNIVLGFDTNFFATTAPIRTPTSQRLLTGQTLYLSLPLMRVLSLEEMKAVIGHELAHFSGADTLYSRQFAPIYRGLSEAAAAADETKQNRSILLLPARLFLRFMMGCFERNAARANRARELRADAIGARAATPSDLGYALIKCGILSMLWSREMEDTASDIARGRFRRNMSLNFEDRLKFDVDPEKLPPLVAFALNEHTPHPTDSHPATQERLTELGLNLDDVSSEERVMQRFFAQRPARLALDNMENVEEALTQIYHQLMIGPRGAPNVERSSDEVFVSFLSAFLAHMVAVDGVVDDREIEVAEREALHRVGGRFDQREFREFCRHPEQLASITKLTEWSTRYLTPQGFEMLLDMLAKIAEADGAMHERERRIIADVRALYDEVCAAQTTAGQAG